MMKKPSICLVLFMFFVPHSYGQLENLADNNEDSCLPTVRDYVTKNNIGGEVLIPEWKYHDRRMSICYNGDTENITSCCNHKMEKRFRNSAEEQIRRLIKKGNSELRILIGRNIAVYEDEIVTIIKTAEQKTAQQLTGTYHMGTSVQATELSRFFNELIDLYDRPDGSIRVYAATSRFFNQLFPLVFHNILNDPTTVELTDEYRRCLIKARNEVQPQPFGQVPQRISTELSQAVALSHLFLSSLRTAMETLNVTQSMYLDSHCSKALVKMQHCAICQKQEAKPCRNLCLNVMRGCLAKLQHMEDPWNRFVDSVNLFNVKDGSMSVTSQHKVFQSIHTRISEAIMHAMETTHKFYNKVTAKCGDPKTPKGTPAPRQTPQTVEVTAPPSDIFEQGRILRQFLFTSLAESKGVYGNLADGLCDEKEFAAPISHGQCWNGRRVSAYEEAVKGKSLEEQFSNPEVKVEGELDAGMAQLIDKKNRISERITSQMEGSKQDDDDFVVYSSGAGGRGGGNARKRYTGGRGKTKANHWNQYVVKQWSGDGSDGDDEDLGSGSRGISSGDGAREDDDDISFENQNPWSSNNNNNNKQNRNTKVDTVSGKDQYKDSASFASSSSVLFSSLVLLTFTLWLNG